MKFRKLVLTISVIALGTFAKSSIAFADEIVNNNDKVINNKVTVVSSVKKTETSKSVQTYAATSYKNGWNLINGVWYYYENNNTKKGWQKLANIWYFFDSNGKMKTGWVKDGSKYYYMNSNGAMQTGWIIESNKYYYLMPSGEMKTGWMKSGNIWYYLSNSGAMATGFINDGGKKYFLDDNGKMITGWLLDSGSWYYFQNNGQATVGWLNLSNKQYHLNESGILDVNTTIDRKIINGYGEVCSSEYVYNNALNYYVDKEYNTKAQQAYDNSISGKWRDATKNEIAIYMNPDNFIKDPQRKYMFLKLDYVDGLSIDELNGVLKGKGVLEGKAAVFIEAGRKANVNPMYLIAHALHETGNGTSPLATGITLDKLYKVQNNKVVAYKDVEKKTTYNMFGIGAWDIDARLLGASTAYTEGWFSVDQAIIGGAQWISNHYISKNQDTLYKMRWNFVNGEISNQYATDVAWAYQQTNMIKALIDLLQNPKIFFEIPTFKL